MYLESQSQCIVEFWMRIPIYNKTCKLRNGTIIPGSKHSLLAHLSDQNMNEPKNIGEEEEEDNTIDPDAREAVESLDGYQEYLKEIRGDAINYGDY